MFFFNTQPLILLDGSSIHNFFFVARKDSYRCTMPFLTVISCSKPI